MPKYVFVSATVAVYTLSAAVSARSAAASAAAALDAAVFGMPFIIAIAVPNV